MERGQQRSALEALLFASDDALSARALYKLLIEADEQAAQQEQKEQPEPSAIPETGTTSEEGEQHTLDATPLKLDKQPSRQTKIKELTLLFEELVDELNADLESTGRAFRIVKVAGGYQFATTALHGELVARLVKSKSKRRLSQAALETLAIISYRQPITKPEIESIRGVSCNEVVNTLLEKNLVTIAGRSDSIGKPLLYGTTDEFLRAFGLHDISDLPKPRELEELMESRADILNGETVLIAEGENVEEFEERLHGLGKKDAEQHTPIEQQESENLPQHSELQNPETLSGETGDAIAPAEQSSGDEHAHGWSDEKQPEDRVQHNAAKDEEQREEPPREEENPQPEIRKMRVVMTTNGRPR